MAVSSAREQNRLKRKITSYIRRCVNKGTPPREKELARKLEMHPSVLSRKAKVVLGRPLSEVFVDAEVACAKRCLRNSELSLNEIAYRCGFGTRANFFLVFKGRTGMTPGKYRAQFHTRR